MLASTKVAEVRAPRETVNDDVVTVLAWKFPDQSQVSMGSVVAEIETSKAVVEVTADSAGYLEILCSQGARVEVGGLMARIHSTREFSVSTSEDGSGLQDPTEAFADLSTSPMQPRFSKKAEQLVEQNKLSPILFAGRGLIREQDVLDFLDGQSGQSQSDPKAESGNLDATAEAFADAKQAWRERGEKGLLADAKTASKHRGKSVIGLAWNYFWRNWLLGMLVRVSPRGVILLVHRMRGVKIGRSCFIDPSATLETAYPERISIGDDVRIAAGAILMTHIKAPHLLVNSGAVPIVDKPIQLKDHCFIGVNAIIMPGVVVGEGCVVASGAVVLSDVPPFCLVSGNPAKVVRKLHPSS